MVQFCELTFGSSKCSWCCWQQGQNRVCENSSSGSEKW